jgi:hypothetical protein
MRLIRHTRNAAPLGRLRTACSRPQRRKSRSASSDCKSSSWLSNRLLVGRMTTRVNGMTTRRSSPPARMPEANVATISEITPQCAPNDARPKDYQLGQGCEVNNRDLLSLNHPGFNFRPTKTKKFSHTKNRERAPTTGQTDGFWTLLTTQSREACRASAEAGRRRGGSL